MRNLNSVKAHQLRRHEQDRGTNLPVWCSSWCGRHLYWFSSCSIVWAGKTISEENRKRRNGQVERKIRRVADNIGGEVDLPNKKDNSPRVSRRKAANRTVHDFDCRPSAFAWNHGFKCLCLNRLIEFQSSEEYFIKRLHRAVF